MLEHLDRFEATLFLKEAKRCLMHGGTIRIAVPDIARKIADYNQHGNADRFVESTYMCTPRPRTFSQRLVMMFVGTRHHLWMYDGQSLAKLLQDVGFGRATILAAGQTTIADPQSLNLREREDESIYVEATKT
jgi:predicted SAM-dependent methyltransferase